MKCGWQKSTSQYEVTSYSEEIKSIAAMAFIPVSFKTNCAFLVL